MTEFMSGFAHLQADNTCAVTCIETFAPLRYLDGNDSTVVLTNSTISFLIDPACE